MPPTAAPTKAPTTSKQQYVSRPEDNYDISDREGSDSDSDSEDEAPRKRVPDWARSKELIPALQAQFCDASNRIDPDTIFPEVQSCDLEDIFDQKKSRYSRRTSSGEWTKDQITQGEKITYRKEMGFTSGRGGAWIGGGGDNIREFTSNTTNTKHFRSSPCLP